MGAVLDESRTYRYELTRDIEGMHTERVWAKPVVFVMLNPSTADESENDPTIRKCMGYAERWGYKKLVVVNLFGYRTPSPKALKQAYQAGINVEGPDNGEHILKAIHEAREVVCGWGNNGTIGNMGIKTLKMMYGQGILPCCLKVSKMRQPYHPLYLKWEQELMEMDPEWKWRDLHD